MARADASLLGLRCDVFDHIATPPIARTKPRFPADQYSSPAEDVDDLGLPSYAKLDVLVAYLTSRNVVRSEAMREFFMTFRLFTTATEVWDLLCARLLWAARQAARTGGESEIGNDVGTRCFVLLRHWIREYFRDDFLSNEKLRTHAANILTALSGVTEFVLSEHFRRIHAQLRRAWVDQIGCHWPLPAEVSSNDDASVPAGGSSNSTEELKDDSGLVKGSVLIDADIGVPIIKSSPQRARPKPKLSLLFGRNRKALKNNEVVLHNKVDLLALRVIDEYHGLCERQAQAQAQEQLQNRLSIPSMLVPENSDTSNSTIETQASSRHLTDHDVENSALHRLDLRASATSPSINALAASVPPIAPPSPPHSPHERPTLPEDFKASATQEEASEQHSIRSTSTTSSSEFRTPTPSLFGNETWSTPLHSPTSMEDSRSIPHEKSMDTLDMDHMVLANTSGESEMDEDDEGALGIAPTSWGPVDINDFERVSYSGSSLSTLSIARESTYSYRGDRASVPALSDEASWSHTRQSLMYTGSPRSSLRSTLSGDENHGMDEGGDDSHSVSLLSEQDNSLLQPCAGYTPKDAAQLKAIPDDDVEGDILGATLQMLEGTYIRSESPVKGAHSSTYTEASGDKAAAATDAATDEVAIADDSLDMGYTRGIPRSNTAELYAQAFGSSRSVGALSNDVDELGIPAPHGVDAILANVREEGSTKSHFISPSVPATNHRSVEEPEKPSFSQLSLHIGAPGATHAPFILSYTARAVAEQMTLIERDVLKQLDWRELVDGRWPTTEPCADSWLHVLERNPPLRGVGLITARFELVCAWVRSELLLCESPALQAQAYSRFVHIAFEALRLQNFATMIQLILGLTSETVRSRMHETTTKLLSENDRDTLERLEALASPSRNFAAIRETHRRLSRTRGCIPFTPMFLADLAANSAVCASNAEYEIHFGKYRTTAQLVQSLLSCVARSGSYSIEPQQALLSKCLYLSKLTQAEELQLSNV